MPLLSQTPVDYYNMVGGIDTISSAIALGTTKFRDAQNVNLFPINGFSWRTGYARLESASSSTNPVTGLYQARLSSGTNILYRTCGTRVESMTAFSGTWSDITNSIAVTAGKDNLWNFAILNDIVVAANDTDTCFQISAGTVTALGGSPAFTSALFAVEFRGYMFYGNTIETAVRQPDRLRFSDINAPNLFTMLGSNNFIDIAKKQGGDLRGAISYNGKLYCFKRHGISAIEYDPVRVNSSGTLFPFIENPNPVVEGVGTQSHRSICKFTTPITNTKQSGAELVFFVDQFGIPRVFDGQTTVQIGYPISKSRDTSITNLSLMDKTRIGQIFAVNYPERSQIHVFMTKDGNQHDTDWVLDYSVGFAWSRMLYADDFNTGALLEKTDGTFRLYFGTYDGKTMEYESGLTDNGVAISPYVILGDAFINSPIMKANWTDAEFRGTTSAATQMVQVDFYKDGDDSSTLTKSLALVVTQDNWDEGLWDDMIWGSIGITTKTLHIGLDAKSLRLKISSTSASPATTIEGLSLLAVPQGWAQS